MNQLLNHLELYNYEIYTDSIGRSKSEVYKLIKNNETLYLKIGAKDVENLSKALVFLNENKVNTPILIKSGLYEGKYYVLMTACLGKMTYDLNYEYAIKVLAKGLKELHSLNIDKCNILRDKNFFLNEIRSKRGVDLSNKQEKLVEVFENSSLDEDLVFAHGDYCLPNVLENNGEISFVDLDNAGVSFRILDLVDCIRSIEYNFKDKKYCDMFLKEYGIERLDTDDLGALDALYELLSY